MSVLFKALQRAEKIRNGDAAPAGRNGGPAGAEGMPTLGGPLRDRGAPPRMSPVRLLVRGLGLAMIASMTVSVGALVLFPDAVEDAFSTLVMGTPAPPQRAPAPMASLPPPVPAEPVPAPAPEIVVEITPEPAPVPDAAAAGAGVPGVAGPEATTPGTTPGTTTDIATLMAAARAVQRQKGEAGPEPAGPTSPPTSGIGEPGGPVRLTGLDAPQVTDLPPEDLEGDGPAGEAPATPPEPRAVEDVLADRARAQQARSVAAPVVVDRPEARRAGAGDAVTVALPSLRSRDTVADAYRLLLRGDFHAALASYEAVLEEDPRSLQALLGRAAALHKLRRLDEARLAYERVLAADSNNREALTNLLAIIAAAAPQEALSRLTALERTAPGFTPVLAQIALVYGQMGADAEAIAYLEKAVAQDPSNLTYRYNLAILLDRAGQRAAAAQAYQAVLAGLRAHGETSTGAGGLSADRIKARLDYLIAAR